jgi:hypothetical protein
LGSAWFAIKQKKRNELIKDWDIMVEKRDDSILEKKNERKYILTELDEFYGKVDTIQLQVLRRFKRKAGKNLSSKTIRSSGKAGERLESASVNGPFLMHHLNSGVYYPKGTGYAQAIYLNPSSRWELEVDRDHPTLKINYNFSSSENPEHQNAKNFLRKCYEINLPIGILFRLANNRFKCLGLGKIISINENEFVIESFSPSHTKEESTKLKEEVLKEYDEITKDVSIGRVIDANYVELSKQDLKNSFKDERVSHQVIQDREKYKISELISKCERTELVIPDFQRFFVWKKEQISAFFDSIFRGYYVGSLLFWEPSDVSIGTNAVTGVDKKDNLVNNQIILDGQQRITSIYYALRSPEKGISGEKVFFYIDFNSFLKSEDGEIIKIADKEIDEEIQFLKLWFPLNKLEDYDTWLDRWSRFVTEKNPELDFFKDIKSIEEIIRVKTRFMLKEFGCPYVALKDVGLEDVIDIFERINTTGVTLNAFDLLIAKLSIPKIKLRNLWEESIKKYPKIKLYFNKSTQGLLILHAMALCFTTSSSCKRSDILKIFENMNSDKEDFENKWNEMVDYTNQAIQQLEDRTDDGFGVIDKRFLPSESMIPVLAALLRTVEKKEINSNNKHHEKIRIWYWASALTNMYSGSSDSQKTSDYKSITKWFSEENVPENIKIVREGFPGNMRLRTVERAKSSNFNAIIGLGAKKGSKDWTQNLGVKNQIDFSKKFKVDVDHVFPTKIYSSQQHNESILNKILLISRTNIQKSKKEPSVVLQETLKKNFNDKEELLETLETHFINKNAYAALLEDDHERFQIEREKLILAEIAKQIGVKISEKNTLPTQTSPDTSYDNILIPRNAVGNCKKEIIWISKYFSESDLETIRLGMNNSIKKIRILVSRKRKEIKSEFKRFKDQFSEIECQMKIMSKESEKEIHGRYLADKEKCYNMIDTEIAKRGQTDDVYPVSTPKNLEDWWDDSYDIFDEWNKFQN